MNADVPGLYLEEALVWSARDHSKSTGQPFLDLSGDDGEARPNGSGEGDDI